MKKNLLLLIPLIVLFSWAGYHEYSSRIGDEVVLEIEGYDPRDLLSGHYLTYRVKYKDLQGCEQSYTRAYEDTYLCLDNGEIMAEKSDSCAIAVKGRCRHWGMNPFEAGIERFYIPEENAAELDTLLRRGEHQASIRVFVTKDGNAYVKDLMFDGLPWREFLARGERKQAGEAAAGQEAREAGYVNPLDVAIEANSEVDIIVEDPDDIELDVIEIEEVEAPTETNVTEETE